MICSILLIKSFINHKTISKFLYAAQTQMVKKICQSFANHKIYRVSQIKNDKMFPCALCILKTKEVEVVNYVSYVICIIGPE